MGYNGHRLSKRYLTTIKFIVLYLEAMMDILNAPNIFSFKSHIIAHHICMYREDMIIDSTNENISGYMVISNTIKTIFKFSYYIY